MPSYFIPLEFETRDEWIPISNIYETALIIPDILNSKVAYYIHPKIGKVIGTINLEHFAKGTDRPCAVLSWQQIQKCPKTLSNIQQELKKLGVNNSHDSIKYFLFGYKNVQTHETTHEVQSCISVEPISKAVDWKVIQENLQASIPPEDLPMAGDASTELTPNFAVIKYDLVQVYWRNPKVGCGFWNTYSASAILPLLGTYNSKKRLKKLRALSAKAKPNDWNLPKDRKKIQEHLTALDLDDKVLDF